LIEARPRLKRRANRRLREPNAISWGLTADEASERRVLTPHALIYALVNALIDTLWRVRLRHRVDDERKVSARGALLSVTEERLRRARLP